MFDTDEKAQNLWLEIKAAETMMNRQLSLRSKIIQKIMGTAYPNSGLSKQEADLEQRYDEYLRLMLVKVAHHAPKATFQAGSLRQDAKAEATQIERMVDRMFRDYDAEGELQRIAFDFMVGDGFSHVSRRVQPGMPADDPDSFTEAVLEHVPPERIVFDSRTHRFDKARFKGMKSIKSKKKLKDLAGQNGWNKDAIDGLPEDDIEPDEVGRPNERQMLSTERDDVLIYEVHVPEYQIEGYDPEDGYNGAIFTLAGRRSGPHQSSTESSDDVAMIRDVRPFFGPPRGTLQHYASFTVPKTPFALAPLAAAYDQIEELNNYMFQVQRRAKSYKRIVLAPASNTDLIQKLQSSDDNEVVSVAGMSKDTPPITLEMGGITSQHIEFASILSERVDRTMAMDEAQRGNVTGRGTATEAAIADAASNVRTSSLRKNFARGVRDAAWTIGWYAYYDEDFILEVGPDDAQAMAEAGVEFEQGPDGTYYMGGGEPFGYESLSCDIDVMSMARSDEGAAQSKAMQAMNIAASLAPLVRQFPEFNWKTVLTLMAEAMNIPEIEEFLNEQLAAELQANEIQMQQQQGQSPTGEGRARIGTPPRPNESTPSGNRGQTANSAMDEARQRGQQARNEASKIPQGSSGTMSA